jgi:hypothetical protein
MEVATFLLAACLAGQLPGSGSTRQFVPPSNSSREFESSLTPQPRGAPASGTPYTPGARTLPANPTRDDSPVVNPLVPVQTPRFRIAPPDLIARLAASQAEMLPGRPIPLVDVLMQTAARPQQLTAVRAYWKLSAALAAHHVYREQVAQLKALEAATAMPADLLNRTGLAAELATASARMREAEVQAIAAQEELAEKLSAGGSQALPLPLDLPHVGAYRSHFDVLFASRTPPARLKFIDHAMPLRRTAIDRRAEAVQAAMDALETAREFHASGEIGPDLVAARLEDLTRQQVAFLEGVRDYNYEIAEYAFGVAAPNASPASLLSMLIKDAAADNSLAERPRASAAADPAADQRPALTPRSVLTTPHQPPGSTVPGSRPAERQFRFKPDGAMLLEHRADEPLFAELIARPAAARAAELARQLHAEASRAQAAGRQITLAQALANHPAEARAAIAAYWQAWERAARYRVLTQREGQLAALQPLVLESRTAPGGPELMLQLRAVLLEAQADRLDGEIASLAAQFDLASIANIAPATLPAPGGAKPESASHPVLLIAATTPHAASFRLDPRQTARSATSSARLASKSLPVWHAALTERAEAVVRADALRAADAREFLQGRQACEVVLADIERQSAAALSFLETLRRYNLGIADYVLASANARGEQLAPLLVAQKP